MSVPTTIDSLITKQLSTDMRAFLHSAGECADKNGFRLFLVGGMVRDLILGRPCRDPDLLVQGDQQNMNAAFEFTDLLASALGGETTSRSQFGTAKLTINGKTVDAGKITKKLLKETLHEAGGVEANVATGYHAIEFLLWGQDLNGTGAGAGNRPVTDFNISNCTNGNCDRRAEYLTVVTDLLIDDLEEMLANWRYNGVARKGLVNGNPKTGLISMLTGLGSLSYGELAGERIKLGLMLHDPEEEHDCFSDNTHNSHYYDLMGMINVYTGRYVRIDGRVVSGPSLADLIEAKKSGLHQEMMNKFHRTLFFMTEIKKTAEAGKAYDQMLAEGDKSGNALVQNVVNGLKEQTQTIEKLVTALNLNSIEFEGSESLDNPNKVFQ